MLCQNCSTNLKKDNLTGNYDCPECQAKFQIKGICYKCGDYVEKLAACGSVSFFCNTCNELKSKSTVKKLLIKIPPQ